MIRVLLAERGLTTFPDDIPPDVRILDLGHNALTAVPGTLAQLQEVDFLYLHDNQLSALPAVPRQVRYLNLSENRFAEFPAALCDLPQLIELRFTDNQLQSLPDCNYPRLRELHLRNNKLCTLPGSIGR
ncbi:MAG TPA: leucine-rich repeat domain-containing protein, partial [Thermoanaerobaculia bacterium]|nr:leucine-rich repeat domain-containing protein [Thermoanaerobaculia bacterium]